MLPERHRKLIHELAAFGTAGAVNTFLGLIVFNLLLGLGSYTASVISTALATGSSFLMNRFVTYRSRPRTSLRRELPLFIAVNLVGLGIQLGILALARVSFDLRDGDRLELNIARFVGVAVGTVFLLLTYRTLVFKAVVPIALVDPVPPPVQAHADDFAELTDPLEVERAEWMIYLELDSADLLTVDLDDEAVRSTL